MNIIKPIAHHFFADNQDVLFDDTDNDDFCFDDDDDFMSEDDFMSCNDSNDLHNVHYNVIPPPRDVNPVSLVLSAPVFDDSDNENEFEEIFDERLCTSTQFTDDLGIDNEEDDTIFMFF
ncbi:Uncharacterized protein QTN25_009717 [Entamoeba marina]